MEAQFSLRGCHEDMIGQELILMGWCHRQRDLGGVLFITLRDIAGEVQIVVDGDSPENVREKAKTVRGEYVLACRGLLRRRTAINPEMKTGLVELHAQELRILSVAETPPLYIEEDIDVNETVRLSIAISIFAAPICNATYWRDTALPESRADSLTKRVSSTWRRRR